jgi:hypothetical protein
MKKISLLLAVIALSACSKESATVVLDKSSSDNLPMEVVIDDTMKIKIVADTSIDIHLLVGEHTLKAKNVDQKFTVKKEGGIINLDNTEYVIYPVEYSTSGKSPFGGLKNGGPILIDSFIIFKNREVLGKVIPTSDKQLMTLLPKLEENEKNPVETEKAQFMKLGKNQFYIHKFWDYNMNDVIPETIETKGISGTVVKYSVMRANYFLLSLFLGNDGYGARTIANVKDGVYDKEQEMAKDSVSVDEGMSGAQSN